MCPQMGGAMTGPMVMGRVPTVPSMTRTISASPSSSPLATTTALKPPAPRCVRIGALGAASKHAGAPAATHGPSALAGRASLSPATLRADRNECHDLIRLTCHLLRVAHGAPVEQGEETGWTRRGDLMHVNDPVDLEGKAEPVHIVALLARLAHVGATIDIPILVYE